MAMVSGDGGEKERAVQPPPADAADKRRSFSRYNLDLLLTLHNIDANLVAV